MNFNLSLGLGSSNTLFMSIIACSYSFSSCIAISDYKAMAMMPALKYTLANLRR